MSKEDFSLEDEIKELFDESIEEKEEEKEEREEEEEETVNEEEKKVDDKLEKEQEEEKVVEEREEEKVEKEDEKEEKKVEKEEKKEEEVDELALMKEQNALLLKQVEELSGRITNPEKKVEKKVEKEEEKEEEKRELDNINFIGEDEKLDDLLDNREKLNSVLNAVRQKTLEHVLGVIAPNIRENILTGLPGAVSTQVQHQIYMKESINDFFKEHKTLMPYRKSVGLLANEIAAEKPELKFEEILTETAEKAYKTLGLKKEVIKNEKEEEASFVEQRSSRRKSSDQRTGLQKEMDELLDF